MGGLSKFRTAREAGAHALRKRLAMAGVGSAGVSGAADLVRIVELPLTSEWSEAEVEAWNKKHLTPQAFAEGRRFWPVQCAGAQAYKDLGGLFGPIGVGWGKSNLSFLIAQIGFEHRGKDRIMLLVPPHAVPKTLRDLQEFRNFADFAPTVRVASSYPPKKRMVMAQRKLPGMWIVPYSQMGGKQGAAFLDALEPQLIIADEAHRLRNIRSAATARIVFRYIEEAHPECAFLSGTMTSKGLFDFRHMLLAALGDGAPIPKAVMTSTDWNKAIDTDADYDLPQNTDSLDGLVQWARAHFPTESFAYSRIGYRRAFMARLVSAPGVVSTGDKEIGTSLTIKTHTLAKPWDSGHEGGTALKEIYDTLEGAWLTPNGDEIEHGMLLFKWRYELDSGFYHRLYWPTPEQLHASRPRLSVEECAKILADAEWHHELLNDYHGQLRGWLQRFARRGLDTPMQVGQFFAQQQCALPGPGGRDLYEAWLEAKDAEFDGMPQRWKQVVRVCDWKVKAAVEWGEREGRGLIWCWHKAVADWVSELLHKAHVAHVKVEAGDAKAAAHMEDPANGDCLYVVAMGAYNEGLNLQHHNKQLAVQFPRPAKIAEQFIGRTHRNGQKEDELVVERLESTWHDRLVLSACVYDAAYVHEVLGTKQKLMLADWDPQPGLVQWAEVSRYLPNVERLTSKAKALLS